MFLWLQALATGLVVSVVTALGNGELFPFPGGPLGELVQWSDIISALYILGHDLVITSEVEQLQA